MTATRLKWVLREVDDRAGDRWSDLPLLSVSISWGVRRRNSVTGDESRAGDLSNYKVCRAGDLVINRMRAFQGALGIAPEDGLVSPDYAVLQLSDSVNRGWLSYLMTSSAFVSTMAALVRGIGGTEAGNVRTPRLNVRDLGDLVAEIPQPATQHAIAEYLDRETAQIDTLISKQKQLIATLLERRQALLERTVGNGLARCDMKPSTLSWISEVPDHWQVANIRRFAQMKTGHTPSRSKPEYWENTTIPWFTLADVWQLRDGTRMYLGETASKVSELGLANSAAELLPERTVVLSRTASVGFAGVMPVPMATSQDFWNWVCCPQLHPEYLVYVFRAMHNEFRSLMIGSTHKTIYQPVAASIRIPVPPMDDQHRIVAYLGEQTAKIDVLIAKTERFIELAKERRAALITTVVTGQLDVGVSA